MAGHTQQPSGRGNPGPAPSPSPGRGPGPGTSERVALKKEIGLVSACTIIIVSGSCLFISDPWRWKKLGAQEDSLGSSLPPPLPAPAPALELLGQVWGLALGQPPHSH
uniref:Solute carrier family 7 member 10 n=1 Tax=Ovis aries TaxID=9940 RepID=A0AC11DZJ4_SHEEP